LADASVSKTDARKSMGVRFPPQAPRTQGLASVSGIDAPASRRPAPAGGLALAGQRREGRAFQGVDRMYIHNVYFPLWRDAGELADLIGTTPMRSTSRSMALRRPRPKRYSEGGLHQTQPTWPLLRSGSKRSGALSGPRCRATGRERPSRGDGTRYESVGTKTLFIAAKVAMAKGRPLKKGPKRLPKFKTPEEEIRFFETHDMAPYWDQLEDVDEVLELAPALERRIRERMKKRMVAIRLEEWQLHRAKEIARQKRVPYQRLLREWISQGLRSEKSKRRAE
jgi:predicted DNA binding CopG/RHH family protein